MTVFSKLLDTFKVILGFSSSRPKRRRKKPLVRKSLKKSLKPAAAKTKKAKPVSKALKPASKKQPKRIAKKSPKRVKPAKNPVNVKVDQDVESRVRIGHITHYFDRIKVSVVHLTHGSLIIGDKILIFGKNSKVFQKVWSMQIENDDVKVAKKGQMVGIKVDKAVAVGDIVYK